MKCKMVLTAIAVLAMAAAGHAAVLDLSVDFGPGGNPVESGFVGQTTDNATHTTAVGDLTVAISGYQGLFNYATTGPNADLFTDFYFKNGGTMTLVLSGPAISASTDYDMTFWAFYGAQARDTTINGTSGTTGPSLGPIAFVNPPTSLSDNAASGTFTSDSAGVLTFAVSGTAARPALNGFQIAAVPEPATMALLGMGGLMMLRRRRLA